MPFVPSLRSKVATQSGKERTQHETVLKPREKPRELPHSGRPPILQHPLNNTLSLM